MYMQKRCQRPGNRPDSQ